MLSAVPDSVVTVTGTPVVIDVLANDVGNSLVITSFSKPENGSLVFNPDKTFTYTPTAGFVGTDGFSYMIRDKQGVAASAEVTITVMASSDATIAMDDEVEVVSGNAVVIQVLANDVAGDGGALQIMAVSVPRHGATNVLSDQTIRYVPQSGFIGIDTFTYMVIDGAGNIGSATVTVKVLAENSPPFAVADAFTIEPGQATVLAVLANDSDPDGGPLQIVGFTMPGHGSLVFNADKTFTYTPDAGFLGTDQFTYTIRDQRGANATAEVKIDIVAVSDDPVAVDDQATTEAGQPVVIDVLTNDELPDGQIIRIIAATMPFHGKLAFNPDKTITYTPNAGFVGVDDFTYTIANGTGAHSKAKVTVTVAATSVVDAFANGYSLRRRIVVPPSSANGGQHEHFPLWVELSGGWLRSVSNGGKVASSDGHDLRFELADGTKLAHEIDRYDAVTGKLGAWVRVPELSDNAATVMLLYYDKPGLVASEAQPAAVWDDYLAVWHLPGSLDASAEGRMLTPAGSLADTAEGLGAGALSLDGDGVLSITDTSWLDGRDALSIQLRSKAQAVGSDRGLLNVGGFGSDAMSDLALRYQAVGFAGAQPVNVIHSKLKTTAGNVGASSAAGTQSTAWQSIAFEWASGDVRPDLYLDGQAVPLSYINQISEPATTQIAGPLYLGAGPRDSATGGWAGLIDEVRFRAGKLGATWLAAEHANQKDPMSFFGIGAEEAVTDDMPSIVAVPIGVETNAGQWIDIDVLAAALPPVPSGVVVNVATSPQIGIASIFGNKIRYTPTAGNVGVDRFTYRLVAAGRTTTSVITVKVKSSVSQGQQGGADELPAPLRTISVASQTEFNAAKAAAAPGDHIILANGTYNLGNISASGTAEHPIVFRSVNNQGVTLSGLGDVTGNNIRLWGFSCGNNNFGNLTGQNFWVIRCRWTGGTGRRMQFKSPGAHLWYCELTGSGQVVIFDTGNSVGGPGLMGIQGHVKGCWFHDIAMGSGFGNANEPIMIGRSDQRTFVQSDTLIEDCLFEDCNVGGQEDETIGIKSSYVTVRNCTFRNTRFLAIRHGSNNLIDRCVSINSPTGGFTLRDADNIIQNSKTIGGSRTAIYAGNLLPTAAGGGNWWSVPTNTLHPQVRWPTTYRLKVYNHEAVNTAPVIGDKYTPDYSPLRPADDITWLGNRGVNPQLRSNPNGYWSNVTPSGQWSSPAPVAYVPPITLTSSQVGPLAQL